MFKHLTDFAYKRSFKEAIGFYLAYLFLIILLAALLGGLMGLIAGQEDSFEFGLRVGNIVAIVVTMGISLLILRKKGFLGNFGYIILIILSGLLAFFGGGLLGLIPVAFLTTRDGQENLTNNSSKIEAAQPLDSTSSVSTPRDVNQETESS
jgi:hypothetical protein